ncbi:MAG: glycerophosphoryl diester phosphodiesterase membrane domain-containing protein [Atopobiaceae bacterium]|nr:glycerophosphoryl diester phosphodiesterase membrane domain-containing protein [Atopobiaceae bacterium]
MHIGKGPWPYLQSMPDLLWFRLVTSFVLGAILFVLDLLATWALYSTGHVAVTGGDFRFIFSSWQGWLLIIMALVSLYLYVAFDLNVKVAYAGHVVRGERVSMWATMGEGIRAIRRFICPQGALVVLYIALIGPIVGTTLSISLTESLKVPSFISSVINANPLYSTVYTLVVLAFALVGFFNIFCVHGVVIDDLGMGESIRRSSAIMRKHWKDYQLKMLLFWVSYGVLLVLFMLLVQVIPVALIALLELWDNPRFCMLLCGLFGVVSFWFVTMFLTPFTLIRMTHLYVGYCQGEPVEIPVRKRRHHPVMAIIVMAILALCVGGAFILNEGFDELFPSEVTVRTIAHRGGGNEGPENTIAGLRTAAGLGAWGSEIDIQRTADGHYVVNHDNTFKRTTGDPRKPGEMTLDEVRQLRVDGESVATYEEMLDAAHEEGVILFVELKGVSADRQMADDAVRIARERGVLDECVFISLDYELVDYLESTYPEAQTGFLTWVGYGNTAYLNCDYLAFEEQSATDEAILAAHNRGKEVFVWTANDYATQRRFMLTDADAIITDNVAQANEVRVELEERDDITRIIDKLLER